jgi:DNA-binding MarR family transcriptional regulator
MAHDKTLRALIEAPALTRRLYNQREAYGLEPRALQVLVAVRLRDRATVKDLAQELALPHKTVSELLTKLQAQGLVISDADPADKRRQLQMITTTGRERVDSFAREALAILG